MAEIEIKVLQPGDGEILASVLEDVFDNEIRPALASEFLDDLGR